MPNERERNRIAEIMEKLKKALGNHISRHTEKSDKNDDIDELSDAIDQVLEKVSADALNKNIGPESSSLISEKNILKSLVDSLEYALTIQDRDYNIIFQNELIKKVYGSSGGKCYRTYEFRESICEGCPVKMSFADGMPHTTERPVVFPSGEKIIWENTASPIKDAEGNTIACLEIVRDITKRKRTETALKDSEEKYRTVVESCLAGVYIIQDDLFRYVNNRFCEIYGYSYQEIVDKFGPLDVTPDEEKSLVQHNLMKRYLGEANELEYVTKAIRKDGKIITIRIYGSIMEYNGRPAISGTVIDITEQTRAIEALRESEAKMRSIVDNIGIGVALISPKMELLELNHRMAEWFPGIKADGHRVCFRSYFTPPRESACDSCPIQETLRDGLVHEATMNIPCGDERRLFRIISSPIRNNKGEVTAVIELAEDITERHILEVQLSQSQKMEAVGRLAGGVAHDFNNLLTVICGYTELALKNIEPSQPLYSNLKSIYDAAVRSEDIVRQLLTFARKQTIDPRVIDLNKTVEGMMKILTRMIGEDTSILWTARPYLWSVKIDPVQIEQILVNLCINARDSISGVGKVVIETDNTVIDESYCSTHSGCTPGEYTMLAVSDNGCGMDRETMDNIFEPFFTTKETGKGTGLGLATVFGIVKQNLGFINVYSELNKGTTFKIYLPRHTGPNDEISAITEKPPVIGRGELILVVEDEPHILEIIKIVLTKKEYNVLIAGTPAEAISLANEHSSRIHLLITDVILPEMNGKDLMEQIRTVCPDIKCLYMSGYTADVITQRGMLNEGVNFIPKPFSMQMLCEKVREVLDQKL